ncbi:MAG: N-acyl homoserine lactone hydrolase [Flavobacterium sp.]|jgi:N-acyl homoserine lactone hydrolase
MIRLIPIESGHMTADEGVLCEGASGLTRFPVCCWVVEHPKGNIIFDTGLHAELRSDTSRLGDVASVFEIDMKHNLKTAVEKQGIDPLGIDYIVFSHLHFDHCGGTAAIPNARIIIQADEWATGKSEAFISGPTYHASEFNLGHDVEEIEGFYDIFGDASVVCVPTPGHTQGHQSLRVELESGSVLLVGDCCYWQRMLEEDLVPPFGFDTNLQRESMQTLRGLNKEGVKLIFGHDVDQWREINHQPLL